MAKTAASQSHHHLNRVLAAGTARAQALEPKLTRVLTPILDRAADEAARKFEKHATLAATASARASRDLVLLASLAPADVRSLLASLALRADVGPNTTMVALKPRPAEAALIAQDGGHPPDRLHVTLAVLGPYDGPLAALATALAPVANAHAPLEGKVAGVGAFEDNGNGAPNIMLPSVPGLVELRVAVTDALVEAEQRYAREYGYVPHMTVAYDETAASFPSRDPVGTPLHFDELLIVRGDQDTVRLPLVGPAPVTAAGSSERTLQSAYDDLDAARRELQTALHIGDGEAVQVAEARVRKAEEKLARELEASRRRKAKQPPPTVPTEAVAPAQPATTPAGGPAAPPADVAKEVVKKGAEEARVEDEIASEAERIARSKPGQLLKHLGQIARTPFGGPADWVAPTADEIVNIAFLAEQLRTKTDPVRQAVIESVMRSAVDGAGVNFDLTNPFAAKVLAQSASQITNIAATTQLNVMRVIKESYDQGFSIPDTATAIRAGMKEANVARATLIARTELAGAVNGGSLAATQIVQSATDQTYYKQWLTAPGATYPRHEDYEGLDEQTVPLGDYFDVGGNQLQFPGDPDGPPEDVCNCVIGETRVKAPGLRAATRRWYEGDVVRVRLASGDELTATPNHPVLRPDGRWVPIGEVNEGDDLVGARPYRGHAGAPDPDAPPTEIREVYRLARVGSDPERVSTSPRDFHGDATEGEVEVVPIDGCLLIDVQAASDEQVTQIGSALAHAAASCTGDGTRALGDLWGDEVKASWMPSGFVGGAREDAALVNVQIRHPELVSLGATAHPDFVLAEAMSNDGTADSQGTGNNQHGFSAVVTMEKVIEVNRRSFSGHVYNLDTGFGWFTAGSLASGNCRCTLVYITAEEAASQGVELGGTSSPPPNLTPEEAQVQAPPVTRPTFDAPPTRVETDDPAVAARAIAEGQQVLLSQPTEIATLIDDLGAMAKKAQEQGLVAPRLDLGAVSVPGTNLFTQDTIGAPRVEMPQLKGVPAPGSLADAMPRDSRGEVDIAPLFYKRLQDEGVPIEFNQTLRVDHLRATQTELDGAKVAGIMDYLKGGGKIEGSIPVTKDGYVIDGHHRWAAEIGLDYASNADKPWLIQADVIDKDIVSVINEANLFATEYGIPQATAFKIADAKAETTIGITPFRQGTDAALNFYDSERAHAFEADILPTAESFGVKVGFSQRVEGTWEGVREPSWSLRAHDGPDGVTQFAAALRAKYDQDGALLFRPNPNGASYAFTLHRVDPDALIPKLKEFGIQGATARGDSLEIVGDLSLADNVNRLAADARAVVTSARGDLSFVSRGDVPRSLPEVRALHPGVELQANEQAGGINLSLIRVPADVQGKGAAAAAMDDLLRYADGRGLTVGLTPEALGSGMTVTQLKAWYKRLGFVRNKGRAADLRFTGSMIRRPTPGALPVFDPYSETVNAMLNQARGILDELKNGDPAAAAEMRPRVEQDIKDLLELRAHPDPKGDLSLARTEQLRLQKKIDDGTATATEKARSAKLDEDILRLAHLRNSDAYAALEQARVAAETAAKEKAIAARQAAQLQDAVARGEELKAEQVASVYAMTAALAAKADDEFILLPPRTIHWSGQGGDYHVEGGAAWRHNGVLFTAEMPTPSIYATGPTAATVGTLQKKVEPWVDSLPDEIRGRLDRVNIFTGTDPDEAYWSTQYHQSGQILASTGQGEMTFWHAATLPDALTQGTLEHEAGHLLFGGGGAKDALAWMTAANKDVDAARRMFNLGHGEALEGSTPGSFRGFFVGVRGVSDYGVTDAAEDWAESIRLYLRDRREGSIGTLETKQTPAHLAPAREPIAPRQVRFAEVYPNRAQLIEEWLALPKPEPAPEIAGIEEPKGKLEP